MADPSDIRARRRENLARAFAARSIVFVGAASAHGAVAYCRALGFTGSMHVVSSTREVVCGIRCVPTVDDLPEVPDAAWVGVPARATVGVVRALADRGTAGAVCYAAGFGEVGQSGLAAELSAAAGDMALIGPNCTGFANFTERVAVTVGEHGFASPQSGVACIAQSGTFASLLAESDRSLPLTHFVSVGNETVIDLADVLAVVAHDDRVDAVVLYLEGLKDAQAFAEAAGRALMLGKPVIALTGGESAAGRVAAVSHTGKMSSGSALYGAFFERLGIVRARTVTELIETAKVLALGRPLRGRRLAVESASGTDAIRVTDLAERYDLALPQPSEALKARLKRVIPEFATPRNPLDVTMAQWGDQAAQARSLTTLLEEPADAALLVVDAPASLAENPDYIMPVRAMIDVAAQTSLPCYVASNLPEGLPEPVRALLLDAGVVPLQGLEDAFAALRNGSAWEERRQELLAAGEPRTQLVGLTPLAGSVLLSEPEAKSELLAHGAMVPFGFEVVTPADAAQAAARIGGSVVLKGVGRALAHKSEVGAVAVGLVGHDVMLRAAKEMAGIPGLEGYLVEEMITDVVAELIVGVVRDPSLGLVLMVGAGGVLAEVLEDTCHLVLPASPADIRAAILRLRVARLLRGFRNRAPGDVDALVETVAAIARYAQAEAWRLVEIDVNPVLVRARGAVAVDALVRLGTPAVDSDAIGAPQFEWAGTDEQENRSALQAGV